MSLDVQVSPEDRETLLRYQRDVARKVDAAETRAMQAETRAQWLEDSIAEIRHERDEARMAVRAAERERDEALMRAASSEHKLRTVVQVAQT